MKRAILFLALGVPSSLAAQAANTTVSSYIAADDGVRGGPMLVGVNVAREAGWTAARLGMAVDAGSTLFASPDGAIGRVGVASVDLDGMVFVGRPSSDGPVIPYALAGVGGRMLSGASTASAITYSYGIGARAPLGLRLSMEGELRYREPLLGAADLRTGQAAGMEYRFGMSMRIGSMVRSVVSAPATFPHAPTTSAPVEISSTSAARRRVADRALDTADDFLGVRYTWGGNTPDEGFDCSGFVRYVFAREGIDLPRVSRDQARAGSPVPIDVQAMEPGDLIAFAPTGGEINHIAIYAGNGRIIHSSSSGRGVRIDDLYSQRGRWYLTHMVAVRRVIETPIFLGAQ